MPGSDLHDYQYVILQNSSFIGHLFPLIPSSPRTSAPLQHFSFFIPSFFNSFPLTPPSQRTSAPLQHFTFLHFSFLNSLILFPYSLLISDLLFVLPEIIFQTYHLKCRNGCLPTLIAFTATCSLPCLFLIVGCKDSEDNRHITH